MAYEFMRGEIKAPSYLVSLVGGRGSELALLARGELGEVSVIVTLPVWADKKQQLADWLSRGE